MKLPRSLWRSGPALNLNLCSEDKQKSYMVGTTWGWENTAEFSFLGELTL